MHILGDSRFLNPFLLKSERIFNKFWNLRFARPGWGRPGATRIFFLHAPLMGAPEHRGASGTDITLLVCGVTELFRQAIFWENVLISSESL